MDNLHQHAATDIDTRELRELQARCIEALQRYGLPEGIINHSRKVARVAEIIARELEASGYPVDLRSVVAGALLHDIGKSEVYRRQSARNHAEASAEIATREGMGEFAPLVLRHILDAIISENEPPLTWEEKIVFYADKIVTDRLVSLEERFRDLLERRKDIKLLLETTYEPTKALESEILTAAGISWDDLKSRFHEDQSL
ncbi:MAG: HD domain-containing protein [Bacillota bacterium]|nr:HD domain-containing protein [Bacillota bacterium]MDI9414740.1 HD domain-containing protein [Bacillota bacterium]NLD13116.1 HD domain-containing protein [Bacillota bacterium]HOB88658.1 HD domain-containing protein [Bacillota bacterium]HOJ57275.1 HD domain-containing protein [Bacillota bacterium]